MWKPEILEAMDKEIRQASGERAEFLAEIRTKLEDAETFFFGAMDGLEPVVNAEYEQAIDPRVRFPFHHVLFECKNSREKQSSPGSLDGVDVPCAFRAKDATLVEQEPDGFCAFFFSKVERVEWEDGRPNVMFRENEWVLSRFALRMQGFPDGSWKAFVRGTAKEPEPVGELEEKTSIAGGWVALLMNKVLMCRNVVTKDVVPPEKLNRKRSKSGKQPLYSYKILEVVPGVPKSKNAGTVPWDYRSPEGVRFHLCRGHIKTYTKEKPLFGKWPGEFWFNDHARGDRKLGRIEKEYHVKTQGHKKEASDERI